MIIARIKSALFVLRYYHLLVEQHGLAKNRWMDHHEPTDESGQYWLGYRNGLEIGIGWVDINTLMDMLLDERERIKRKLY